MFFDNYVSIKVFKHIFSAVQCGKATGDQKSDSVSTRVALATSTGTKSLGKQWLVIIFRGGHIIKIGSRKY